MKHSLSVLILSLIVACASCTRKPDSSTTRVEDDCQPLDTAKFAENISLTHAAELISNFLNHPQLGGLGKNRAIGGTFPLSQFYTFDTSVTEEEGALLWFCYNDPDFNNHAFFLSVERRTNLDTFPDKPSSPSLLIPIHTFRYQETATNQAAVEEYLRKRRQSVSPTARLMRADTVETYADDFRSRFDRTHAKYPFSFFNNDSIKDDSVIVPFGLQAFLNQVPGTMKYVRYYFGYDSTLRENKIRVILFGVDSSGRNICQYVVTNKDGCKTMKPAIILQKSIPPQ